MDEVDEVVVVVEERPVDVVVAVDSNPTNNKIHSRHYLMFFSSYVRILSINENENAILILQTAFVIVI